jgi:sigma-B regulation protein RsbU (phosphoserine phosphatase)
MAAAFEPYQFNPNIKLFCPYVYKESGFITFTSLTDPEYDYLNQDWYLIAKKLNKPVWSEPYLDEGGGGVIMSTYSYPVTKNKKFIGVITADISMDKLNQIVSSIKILKSGFAFLISEKGKFICHPNKDLILKDSIEDYAKKQNNEGLLKIVEEMKNKKTGFNSYSNNGKKFQVYYSPIKSTNWYIGIVFPNDELFAPLKKLANQIFLIGVIGIFLIIIAIIWALNKTTVRIKTLSEIVEIISKGDFNSKLPVDNTQDELGKLSQAFERMQISLKEYIDDLAKATANKQKIESELAIAKEIQMSILPKIFPPFPNRKELNIYATIKTAKEVGGDLYDFFFIDEDRFCFLIGDVSGKGIPASLFMAVAKTLLKITAAHKSNPAEILYQVNNELSHNNDSCMFVTVFLGILNIKTGEIKFSNAGHNPPIIKTNNDTFWLKVTPNPALGVFPSAKYDEQQITLNKNDIIFMYTDGINEAFNVKKEQYSSERLLNNLKDKDNDFPKNLINHIMEDVKTFTGEAEQSDDMTILCIRYKGLQS